MVESIWSGIDFASRLCTTRATLPMSAEDSASASRMLARVAVWYGVIPWALPPSATALVASFLPAVSTMYVSSEAGVDSEVTGYVAGKRYPSGLPLASAGRGSAAFAAAALAEPAGSFSSRSMAA